MAVFRVEKTGDFTVMSNSHFREKGMSLKAKGLLSLMLFLPENWDYSVDGLCTICRDGESGVKKAIKELESFGYLVRRRAFDDKGRITGFTYDIYEDPKLRPPSPSVENPLMEKPSMENPPMENPLMEKPSVEKEGQSNTNNNKILNKQILTNSSRTCTGAPARKKRTDQGAREYSSFDADEFYAAAIARSERILAEFAAELETEAENENIQED